jgi:hypothetical protein
MGEEIRRYTFHVNSDKRSSGTSTDMTLTVKDVISLKAIDSVFYMDVHSVNIPFSFYQLSTDIQTLQCIFTDTTGNPKTANVVLTSGNYTTISVLDELSARLIAMAQVSSGLYVGFTPVLSFVYSTTTSKSTMTMTGPANASIQMNFATNLNLGTFFGMDTNRTISSLTSAVSTKIAISNPVNYLLVRSGNLQQQYNKEFIVETDTYSDILYRVPVGTSVNTWLQHLADTDPVEISNNNISSVNIYLTTNLTYTPVDLQGANWAISFSIIEKKKPNYVSITQNLLSNLPVPTTSPVQDNTEEIVKLEDEMAKNTAMLEKYLKRLEARTVAETQPEKQQPQ